ncbi:MAG: SMI1/KNR4 family protein [Pseudomonadota bacterium]
MDDPKILERLPESLVSVLTSLNGFVQFGGGLHLRGACIEPAWHSLRRAWLGPGSINDLFPAVHQDWVPFAEDCVGDQFLLNSKDVIRLPAETGELEEMGLALGEFLRRANTDPIGFLAMEPLLQFRQDQGDLPDGHLVHAYPPFCTEEAANGVSLGAVPAWELHQFHSELAKSLPDSGGKTWIEIRD